MLCSGFDCCLRVALIRTSKRLMNKTRQLKEVFKSVAPTTPSIAVLPDVVERNLLVELILSDLLICFSQVNWPTGVDNKLQENSIFNCFHYTLRCFPVSHALYMTTLC